MRFLKWLFIIYLLTSPALAQQTPQQEKDSLLKLLKTLPEDTNKVNVLNRLCFICAKDNSKKALDYGKKAFTLANELKFKQGIVSSHSYIGYIYRISKNYDQAISSQNKAYLNAKELKDSSNIAESLRELGIIYRDKGDFSKSLHYFLEALKIYERTNEKIKQGHTFASIGMLYYMQKKHKQSLDFHQKALQIHKIFNEQESIAIDYNNLGNVYADLKDYDQALIHYSSYKTIKEKLGKKKGVAIALSNIGYIYIKQKKFKPAIEFCTKSLKLRDELGLRKSKMFPLLYLAEAYAALKKFDKAIFYGTLAFDIAKDVGAKYRAMQIAQTLSEIYKKSGDYENALNLFQQHKAYTDSIFNEKKSKQIADMAAKYDTEKKEKENEYLKKESAKNKAILRQRTNLVVAITFGALLLVILAIVLYQSNQRKQHTNQALVLQKQEIEVKTKELGEQKEEISQQAHELKTANEKLNELSKFKTSMTNMIVHDLKNPLAGILGLASNSIEGRMDKAQLVATTQQMLHMVQNILDVQKAEETEVDFNITTVAIKETIQEAVTQQHILANAKNITLRYDTPLGDIVRADKDILLRILANLLSNAIKFTPENGKISVRTLYINNYSLLKIELQDNGVGIPQDQLNKVFDKFHSVTNNNRGNFRSTGLGLTFCKMAVEKQGGNIGVTSNTGQGSTFWFTLPLVSRASEPQETRVVRDSKNVILEEIHQVVANLKGKDYQLVQAIVVQIRKQGINYRYPVRLMKTLHVVKEKVTVSPEVSTWMQMLQNDAVNDTLFEALLTLPAQA